MSKKNKRKWWQGGNDKRVPDNTGTYSYSSTKDCHIPTRFEVTKEWGLTCCGKWDGGPSNGDIFIDLLGDGAKHVSSIVHSDFPVLLIPKRHDTISIDWPDGGTPDLDKEWWTKLATLLKQEKKEVLVRCMGGHGRTGTAMAILINLLWKTPNPIVYLRKEYCEEAVESQSQVDYINKITGLSLKDEPSRLKKTYTIPTDPNKWRPLTPSGDGTAFGDKDFTTDQVDDYRLPKDQGGYPSSPEEYDSVAWWAKYKKDKGIREGD